LDLAFATLRGADEVAILGALDRIEERGDAAAVRPLLEALVRTEHDRVRQRIIGMLQQVKAPNAAAALLAALEDDAMGPVRGVILSSIWNAGLDVRDHLDRFIHHAEQGDALIAFECLTILENQEIWPEKAVRRAIAHLEGIGPALPGDHRGVILTDILTHLRERVGVLPDA
jgi:HEAT repeat protein